MRQVALLLAAVVGNAAACVPVPLETSGAPLPAYCTARVSGRGEIDVESDYLPRVVQCENGAAGFEALKAQAVAARSYLYYRMRLVGQIADGQSDQVYSCGRTPTHEHVAAVRETSGLVLSHGGQTVATFYVAGAEASAPDCIGEGAGLANTERWVTYNEGRSGDDVDSTELGNHVNAVNRGCMSQNGADCLADTGVGFEDILRFYYGEDSRLIRADGGCIEPLGGDADPFDDEDGEQAGPPPGCACDDTVACTPGCACDPDCARCTCDWTADCDLDEYGERCACDAQCQALDAPFDASCACDGSVSCDMDGDRPCDCDPDCAGCDCDWSWDCDVDDSGCTCPCDVDCSWTFAFNGRCGCDVDFECNAESRSCGCSCDPDCTN